MSWINRCLTSCTDYDAIVVDNHSSDETIPYIKMHFPQVEIISQNKNLGFGQANNIGISHALKQGTEYVFLLNQDAYLHPGCIEKLIAVHGQNQEFGILSPIHLNGEGNRLDERFSNYMTYRNNADFYSDYILDNVKQNIYEVPFVNAAGWLLPKKTLETIGGFDPIFFHYGEDDNYCQRVLYHNMKIGVVPNVFINHDRENRDSEKKPLTRLEKLQLMERRLKAVYGNINKDNLSAFDALLQKRKRTQLKSLIKLNFKKSSELNREIVLMQKIQKELEKSRNRNKEKGKWYL